YRILVSFLATECHRRGAVFYHDPGYHPAVGSFDDVLFVPSRDVGVGIENLCQHVTLRKPATQVDQIRPDLRPRIADAVAAAAGGAKHFLAAGGVSAPAGRIMVAGNDLLSIAGYLGKQCLGALANAVIAV